MASARWRPLPRWLAIIGMTAIVLSVHLVVAQADQEPKPHTARFDLLRAWLDAAERHEPGLLDPPLFAAARWSLDDLIKLRVDVSVLFFLVERPSLQRVRFVPSDEMRRTMSPRALTGFALVFEGPALDELRALAHRVRFATPDAILKRGVLLHTDVVTLGLDAGEPASGSRRPGFIPLRVYVDDGRLGGMSYAPAHWELARLLAARIAATANAEHWVTDWYRATVAFLQRERQYGSEHLRQAIKVVSADARLLLLAGAEHEALASPAVQTFLKSGATGSSVKLGAQSADRELVEAERLLRQALEIDDGLDEARIRLGRVLGLAGRHAAAAMELRAAAGTVSDPLLEYYASLFLGAQLNSLADQGGARRAFARAAELYPRARSAHLGLAQLAWRMADPLELSRQLGILLDTEDPVAEIDPWFTYHSAQGRDAAALLQSVRGAVAQDRR